MRSLVRLVAVLLLFLGFTRLAFAGTVPPQILSGAKLNEAAEQFVKRQVGVAEVHGVYAVPDKMIPGGRVALKPRWGDGTPIPNDTYRGRLHIPIGIWVNGQFVQQVGITVQVGGGMTDNLGVRSGDAVTVALEAGGLRIEVQGRAEQSGFPGERVRVAVLPSKRMFTARVISNHEVLIESER